MLARVPLLHSHGESPHVTRSSPSPSSVRASVRVSVRVSVHRALCRYLRRIAEHDTSTNTTYSVDPIDDDETPAMVTKVRSNRHRPARVCADGIVRSEEQTRRQNAGRIAFQDGSIQYRAAAGGFR